MSTTTNSSAAQVLAPLAQEGVQVFPTSSAQQRFWMLDQLDSSAAAYTIPVALRLVGTLDGNALRSAVNAIVARHESLRTVFALEGEEPVQVVLPELDLAIEEFDVTALPPEEREAQVRTAAATAANQPFDLARGPLVRASLLRLAADEHVLFITLHHTVADGWSIGVLYRELEALYSAFVGGGDPSLPSLPLQYPDYAVWQRKMLESAGSIRQLTYWKEALAGPLPVLELPTDRPRPALQTTNGAKREILLDLATVEGMRALARRENATPYVAFLTAFSVLLQRYSAQDDLIIGSITAGRQREELASLIGLFVNTVALRIDVSSDPSYRELLRRVREVTTSAMANQEIPFEEIAEAIGAGRDRSRSPVFQVAFQLLESLAADLALPGLVATRVPSVKDTTKFDLTLMLNAAPDGGLRAVMEYNTDLYDAGTIDRMLEQYRTLLGSIVREPAKAVTRLAVLPAREQQLVVTDWNQTATPWPANQCVHDSVREQAARTPDAVALEMDTRRMTFADLDRRSNRVAHRLRHLGVKPGVGVGVCVERSPELIVALLGVLKAGGHYVPLATDYPVERLAFMRADAGLDILLTSPDQIAGTLGVHVIPVDETLSAFADCPESAVTTEVTPESAAYVIYTSGSTGKPKGVVVPHRAVVNYIHWMRTAFPHDGSDAIVLKAPVSFDASVWELYLPLFTGARMVLARAGGASDPAYLMDLIHDHHVTSVQFVPSQLQVLTEVGGMERCTELRRLFCGGEALPAELLGRIATILPSAQVTNLYGPTETTVYSTYWTLDRTGFDGSAPIGRPVANTRVYVLDAARAPMPIGVPGELYIAGTGVSHGYLGREELTAEKFVPDSFAPIPGARMYRTGDRVRWRADGMLEYLGRIDHQVKLRGHRIELGEVESVLANHPGVATAVAIVREDSPGDKRLVAYVVMSGDAEVTPAVLREHVRQTLPDIMVPSAVVVLAQLPLNANAKLDRAQLPAPDGGALATDAAAFVAPRTPLEVEIAAVWAAVLHVERVGVHDDFFDLGGHSLAAMRILARLTARVPGTVTLGTILKARTVAGLAAVIDTMPDANGRRQIARRSDPGPAPLSHSQQLIWLFEQMTANSATYNVPMVRRVHGSLDVAALQRALVGIVTRHEILRTTFEEIDGEARQVVHAEALVDISIVDLHDTLDGDVAATATLQREAARPFDLTRDRLLRGMVVRLPDNQSLLLLVTHHIAFDGGSVGVLMRELTASYSREIGESAEMPSALPIQFADYALWERETVQDQRMAASLSYWRTELDGAPGSIDLPTDRARNATPSGPGARYVTTYSPALAAGLRALAREHDATLFMVLLAGFQVLLHRYSGQDDLVVGSPIAGRVRPETQDLIGYFANTLALRARFGSDATFVEQLAQVRRTCLDAFEHQDVPYEQIVLDLRPNRDAREAALFSVMFVLQDGDTAPLRLGNSYVTPAPVDIGAAKFDLSFSAAETPAGLRVAVEYRADLFDRDTIERMTAHFEMFLRSAVVEPAERIARLSLLTPADRATLSAWSSARSPTANAGCIHHRFEAEARRSPDRIAVTCEGEPVTYADLNRRANRLAHRLRAAGVGPDILVGLCLERSTDLVVAILGILKAGGAYLPLDPSYPGDRLAFMLADAAVPVVVAARGTAARLPASSASVLLVDGVDAPLHTDVTDQDPVSEVQPHHLAYVIYTSGSTGRPKGVMVTHQNVSRLLSATEAWFTFGNEDVWTLFHSYAFDFSVWELWGALAYGGRLVVVPFVVSRSPELFLELLHREGVTVLNQTPSAFRQLITAAVEAPVELALRFVIFGGEALEPVTLQPWLEVYGAQRPQLINMYGITETTVHVTYRPIGWDEVRGGRGSVIGRPIPDLSLHVLDEHGNEVPVGVPGEIYVGGAGVARGYLNRAELTATRFLPDPFSSDPRARLYRTGDLARWRRGGDLEYLGRLDDQVKLRGFRIELGEIESALAAHAGVRECVVLLDDHAPGDKRLVAYYTATPGAEPTLMELRESLLARLPDYMVPAAWKRLERLPLTPNGKVDRRVLPAPDVIGLDETMPIVAPNGALEQVIAEIWAEVLGVPRVSVAQDFFSLGGHSLLATQVVARVTRLLRTRATLRSFFEHPTVHQFAAALAAASPSPGQVEKVAAAVLRIRDMTSAERDGLRAGSGAP